MNDELDLLFGSDDDELDALFDTGDDFLTPTQGGLLKAEDPTVEFETLDDMIKAKQEELSKPHQYRYFDLDAVTASQVNINSLYDICNYGVNRVINERSVPLGEPVDRTSTRFWNFKLTTRFTEWLQDDSLLNEYTAKCDTILGEEKEDKGPIFKLGAIGLFLSHLMKKVSDSPKLDDKTRKIVQDYTTVKGVLLEKENIKKSLVEMPIIVDALSALESSQTLGNKEKVYLFRLLYSILLFVCRETKSEKVDIKKLLQHLGETIVTISQQDLFTSGALSTETFLTCLLDSFNVIGKSLNNKLVLKQGCTINTDFLNLLYAIPTDDLSSYAWLSVVNQMNDLSLMGYYNCCVTLRDQKFVFEEWAYGFVKQRKIFNDVEDLLNYVTGHKVDNYTDLYIEEMYKMYSKTRLYKPIENHLNDKASIDDQVLDYAAKLRSEFGITLDLSNTEAYNQIGYTTYNRFFKYVMKCIKDKAFYEEPSLASHKKLYDEVTFVLKALGTKGFNLNCEDVFNLSQLFVLKKDAKTKQVTNLIREIGAIQSIRRKCETEVGDKTEIIGTLRELGFDIDPDIEKMVLTEELSYEEIEQMFDNPENYEEINCFANRKVCLYQDLYESLKVLNKIGYSKRLIASTVYGNAIQYQIDPKRDLEDVFTENAYFMPLSHSIHLTDMSVGSLSHELLHAIDATLFKFLNHRIAISQNESINSVMPGSQYTTTRVLRISLSQLLTVVMGTVANKTLGDILKEEQSLRVSESERQILVTIKQLEDKVEASEYYHNLQGYCLSTLSDDATYLLIPTEILARMVESVVSSKVRSQQSEDLTKIQLIISEEPRVTRLQSDDFISDYLAVHTLNTAEIEEMSPIIFETLKTLGDCFEKLSV